MKAEYDSKTAITFLMIGLGIGAFLSVILPSGQSSRIPTRKSDQPKTPGLGRMSA